MATTNLGRVSLVIKGVYDPAATYERLDVISYLGSSFIVKRTCKGKTPVEGLDYLLSAMKGDKGDKGDQGIQGVVGPKVDVAASLGTSTVYAVSQKLLTDEVDKMTSTIATIKSQSDVAVNTVSSFDERTLNTQAALNYLSKFLVNQAGLPANGLYADFVNNVYLHNGILISFNDLFNFTRAGKAWLVKETGLQEYAADVPRLDSGLLIEGELTNQFKNNAVINNYGGDRVSASVIDDSFFGKAVTYTNIDTSAAYSNNIVGVPLYPFAVYQPEDGTLRQIYVKKDSAKYFQLALASGQTTAGIFDISKGTLIGQSGKKLDNTTITSIGDYWLIAWTDDDNGPSISQFYMSFSSSDDIRYLNIPNQALKSVEGDKLTIAIPLYANPAGDVTSSTPIITGAAPVTRPADFLLNKITGTSVTGDWDSTLTLSIVAGKLVHSGYGRIRSLEIN